MMLQKVHYEFHYKSFFDFSLGNHASYVLSDGKTLGF